MPKRYLHLIAFMDHLSSYRRSHNLKDLMSLYKPYQQRVFRMSMHYLKNMGDSEDAVVDIFLELKEQLLKHEVENFPAWLHSVVRNHCLKKLQKKARSMLAEVEFAPLRMESDRINDLSDRMLELLPRAIDNLSERQRWCIVLFYLQGKSYHEIEVLKGYTNMEVKSAIQNGKIQLEKYLTADAHRSI
jgi:RNA polymerase sigma-70 factor (ECF subfamily)